MGALAIKASNYLACISRFLFGVLEDFSSMLPLLSEDARVKVSQLEVDGLAAAKQLICSSKHVLESSARTLSTVVALRRFGWLHSTSLSSDTKSIIEDIAFDGTGLFNANTDSTLCHLDKDIKASRSLGVASRPFSKRKPYCLWKLLQRSPDRYSHQSSSSSSHSGCLLRTVSISKGNKNQSNRSLRNLLSESLSRVTTWLL